MRSGKVKGRRTKLDAPAHSLQHYVPKFLIKKWPSRNGKFDVTWKCPERRAIIVEHLAVEHIFSDYGLWSLDGDVDPTIIERQFYGKIDGIFSRLRNLMSDGRPQMSDLEKVQAVEFFQSLHSRQPSVVKSVRSAAEKARRELDDDEAFADQLRSFGLTKPPHEAIEEFSGISIMDRHILGLQDLTIDERAIDYLLQSVWMTFDAPIGQQFYLTDNPLVSFGSIKQDNFGCFLPISPRRAIVIVPKAENYEEMKRGILPKIVRRMNTQMIEQSTAVLSSPSLARNDIEAILYRDGRERSHFLREHPEYISARCAAFAHLWKGNIPLISTKSL